MSVDKSHDKKDRITDVISGIEEKYIEETAAERERDMAAFAAEKKKRRTAIIKLSMTVAACVAVAFAAKSAIAGLFGAGAPNVNDNRTVTGPEKTESTKKPTTSKKPDREYKYVENSFNDYEKCKPIVALNYPKTLEFPSYNNEQTNDYTQQYRNWSNANGKRITNAQSLHISEDFYKNTIYEFLADTDNKNRIYSPVNFYLALAMLSETTDGNSRAELLDLLGEEDIESVRSHAEKLWVSNYRNDITSQTVLGNSIWLDKSLSYKKKTVMTLAESYYAECFKEKLSDEKTKEKITDWINTKTGGHLSEAAEKIALPQNPKFMIYSTLYFKGKWEQEFMPQNNELRIFHSPDGDITTEFMYAFKEYGPYYFGEDYGAVKHEFAQGGSMWFILPDEDKTIEDVLKSGEYYQLIQSSRFTFETLLTNMQTSIVVKLRVPKFDISSDLSLSDGLKKLGVDDVFEPGKADFSKITDEEIVLENVRHAARVTIDEKGCTAAAFTEMSILGAARPPEEEIEFVLDRPFIFVITSDVGEPLFIGTVYNP